MDRTQSNMVGVVVGVTPYLIAVSIVGVTPPVCIQHAAQRKANAKREDAMAKSALALQNENENEILTAEAKAVKDGLEYFTKFKALTKHSPAPKNPPAPIPVKSPEDDAVHGGQHNHDAPATAPAPAETEPADGGHHNHYAPAADTTPAPNTSSDPLAAFLRTQKAPKTTSSATAPPATAISNSPSDRSEDFEEEMSDFLASLEGVPPQFSQHAKKAKQGPHLVIGALVAGILCVGAVAAVKTRGDVRGEEAEKQRYSAIPDGNTALPEAAGEEDEDYQV
jgi:hypothetical protein